jgi:alpha-glucosidase
VNSSTIFFRPLAVFRILVHHLASRGHQNLKKRWFQVLALALTAAFVTASCIGSGGRRSVKVVSPDGKNIITLACPEKAGGGPPTFAIARSGRQVILPSAFKIELSDKGDMAAGAKILMVQEDRADETFVMLWGKSRTVRNRFSRARVHFENPDGTLWDLELRAYDDGIAFRYGFPEQPRLEEVLLREESTEFRLAGKPTLLMTTTNSLAWSHERLFTRVPLALVPENCLIEMPVLAVWPDGTSAALTEAGGQVASNLLTWTIKTWFLSVSASSSPPSAISFISSSTAPTSRAGSTGLSPTCSTGRAS